MLFVFYVDIGTIITFDIELRNQTVDRLKEAIQRECNVAAGDQVLLMSGGETLEDTARVSSYVAGTDTNPIYLFSMSSIRNDYPPMPSIEYGADVDLQNQIDSSLMMPATYQTLVARVHLAQHCWTLAREQKRICERLVHEQHLQQQGWAAVVANLEDVTQSFQTRVEILQQNFDVYISERQHYVELLAHFREDLATLSKMPILPALRAQVEDVLGPDDQPSRSEEGSEGRDEKFNLFRWISAKDNERTLEQVVEHCARGLEQFDEKMMESLKTTVNGISYSANKQDMKEIKGLGERLFGLQQLLGQARTYLQEQKDLALSFQQNNTRASNLGDASILPDLCASHRGQLLVMLQNHNKLRDIRRRCTKAKEELSSNLHHRLKWIVKIENVMSDMGVKVTFYNDNLKRLRRHLEILQQIHQTPQMYMNAVAEVVRRRTFAEAFLFWATNLACQLVTVRSEELARRKEFESKFDGHFLHILFPGLEDTPPPFATEAPDVFDDGLPKLTVDDMESLRSQLPDLALTTSSPDLTSITQFFLSKSLTDATTEGNKEKDSTSMRVDVADATKEQEQTKAPMLFDRGGFESETDTEEFEKIGQGAADSKPGSFDGVKQMRQKQMEVGASRSVSPASSTSTNVSPLNSKVADLTNRSSSSSEPGSFHFPSLSVSERPAQLSPLTECAENGESSCLIHRATTAKDFPSNKYDHETPSATMEDEPNSSLSPNHPCSSLSRSVMCDGQQQQCHQLSGSGGSSPSAGVGATDFVGTEFYMDESLPSSLSEHPADGHHQAIVSLLQENLGNTREEVERLRMIVKTLKAIVGDALTSLKQELSVLRDRTDEEKTGFSKLIDRIREIVSLYSCECDRRIREREQELTVDHELEMADVKKLIESREEEIRTLKRNLLEKETELTEFERLMATMRSKLENEQSENRDLKTRLEEGLNDQQRLVKEATDKLEVEYKAQLESIRSRFKLLPPSTCTMERSPSDTSLEKIDKPDFIEFFNQTFGYSMVKSELPASLRSTEKKSADCISRVAHDLRLASQMFEDEMRMVEMYKSREVDLLEECMHYKNTIKQLMKSQSFNTAFGDSDMHKESREEQLKMSQTSLEEVAKSLETDKDEVEICESKKVRLEATNDSRGTSRKMEMLEKENKRLNSELQSLRESKKMADAKIEMLEANTMRLEVELIERCKYFITPDSSSSSESRDKDTSASVAMASKSIICRDAATSTTPLRRCTCSTCLTRMQKKAKKIADKLVELGHITVTRCNPGDNVLMFWDASYGIYLLYQVSMTMFFLNSDCPAAGMDVSADGTPRTPYHIVQVIDKQYCHARKPENRYRVPSGTKFYQVNVEISKDSAAILSSIQK